MHTWSWLHLTPASHFRPEQTESDSSQASSVTSWQSGLPSHIWLGLMQCVLFGHWYHEGRDGHS
jgi:hypothetical protein